MIHRTSCSRSLMVNCMEAFQRGFKVALMTLVLCSWTPMLTSQYGSLFPVSQIIKLCQDHLRSELSIRNNIFKKMNLFCYNLITHFFKYDILSYFITFIVKENVAIIILLVEMTFIYQILNKFKAFLACK